MIILGIDPGVAILGWSLLKKDTNHISLMQYGSIQTPAHTDLTDRLVRVYDELKEIITLHKPDQLALETLFFVKNAKTLAQVGHARGVVLLLAGQFKIPVAEYAPKQIKLALTGYGAADKKQMQLVLQRMLNLKSIPKPDDAADAVAVGLCHSQYSTHLGKSAVTV